MIIYRRRVLLFYIRVLMFNIRVLLMIAAQHDSAETFGQSMLCFKIISFVSEPSYMVITTKIVSIDRH